MHYIYGGVGSFGGTNIYSVRHCISFLYIISSTEPPFRCIMILSYRRGNIVEGLSD